MKVKNPVSQKIRIFPKINQKKKDCKTEKFKLCKVMFKSMFIYALNTWSGLFYQK